MSNIETAANGCEIKRTDRSGAARTDIRITHQDAEFFDAHIIIVGHLYQSDRRVYAHIDKSMMFKATPQALRAAAKTLDCAADVLDEENVKVEVELSRRSELRSRNTIS